METALDVLSRAATMVQDNANETRLTAKELPTTKWRRERRMRAGEYAANASPPCSPGPPTAALPVTASTVATSVPHHIHYYGSAHTSRFATLPYHPQPSTNSHSVYLQNIAVGGHTVLQQQATQHLMPNTAIGMLASSSMASPSPSPTSSSSSSSQTSNLLLTGSNMRMAHRHNLHGTTPTQIIPIIVDSIECHQQQQQQHHRHQNAKSGHLHDDDDDDDDDMNDHENQSIEHPLDMTVSSSHLKQRESPPPPYREPLPGSNYITSLVLPRPSVITQAPPKRKNNIDNHLTVYNNNSANNNQHQQQIDFLIKNGGTNVVIKTQSNKNEDNVNTAAVADNVVNLQQTNINNCNRTEESIIMCENVIDEHFRRSLGANYLALFSDDKTSTTTSIASTISEMDEQPVPLQLTASTTSITQTTNEPLLITTLSSISPSESPTSPHSSSNITATAVITKPLTTSFTKEPFEMTKVTTAQLQPQQVKSFVMEKSEAKRYGKLKTVYLQQQLKMQKEQQQQIENLYDKQSLTKKVNNNNNNSNEDAPQTQALSLQRSKTPELIATTSDALHKIKNIEDLGNVSDNMVRKVMRMTPINDINIATTSPLTLTCNKLKSNANSSTTTNGTNTSSTTLITCKIINDPVSTAKRVPSPTPAIDPSAPTIVTTVSSVCEENDDILASVDDHFAKALGDKWKELQVNKNQSK